MYKPDSQSNSAPQFILIGMSDSVHPYFTPEVLQIIREGRFFSGGLRHHELVKHLLPQDAEWIDIITPLDSVFDAYQNKACVVVFASGDPLFFGFANTIKKRVPQAQLQIFPFFNSLQVLAHRLQTSYDDMRVVSLTGRPWHEFDKALIERTPKIGVLTDRQKTPQTIAERMLEYGYTNYTMIVGEHLGHDSDERIRSFTLEEVKTNQFTHPNNLLLIRNGEDEKRPRRFGIPDELFEHLNGRTKMITKAPIRLITLSTLDLYRRHSFWDIGFCTGSVSIEAKLQFPHLSVTSFEIRPEGEMLMQVNSRRFGTPGINTVIGDFAQADLSLYPAPDAVFIGGHGGALKNMIQQVCRVLQPGGIIVFNSVSPESKKEFIEGSNACGLTVTCVHRITLDEFNPIEILQSKFTEE